MHDCGNFHRPVSLCHIGEHPMEYLSCVLSLNNVFIFKSKKKLALLLRIITSNKTQFQNANID